MTLYFQQNNKYPQAATPELQIILIHGWAMNSAVWEQLSEELSALIPVTVVDLPGYGKSDMLQSEYSLSSLAESCEVLLRQADKSIVLGWSMGGLVAMELAKLYPEKVCQLILVGSSPCFVQNKNWPWAIEESVFRQFSSSLKQDVNKTINRFMALQMLGGPTAKQDARRVSRAVLSQGEPDFTALDMGLEILLNEDRRDDFTALTLALTQPIWLICGERDTMVKQTALEKLSTLENVELAILPEAGHVPFVSHFDEFYATLSTAIETHLS